MAILADVKISAGDIDWKGRVVAAFKYRLEFELLNLDKLEVTDAELCRLASDWSQQWNYRLKITRAASIRFRPNELPTEQSIWNAPLPALNPRKRA